MALKIFQNEKFPSPATRGAGISRVLLMRDGFVKFDPGWPEAQLLVIIQPLGAEVICHAAVIVVGGHFKGIEPAFGGQVIFDHCTDPAFDAGKPCAALLPDFALQGLGVRLACLHAAAGEFVVADLAE